MGCINPARQSVRNVACIAERAAALTEIAAGRDASTIVHSCSPVEPANVRMALLLEALFEAVT